MKDHFYPNDCFDAKHIEPNTESFDVRPIYSDRSYHRGYPFLLNSSPMMDRFPRTYCHEHPRPEKFNSLQILSSFYHNHGGIYPNLPQNFIAVPTCLSDASKMYEPYRMPHNLSAHSIGQHQAPSMTSTESCCDTTTEMSDDKDDKSSDARQMATWTYRRRSERWTLEEQEIFKNAMNRHGRNWKMIKKYLPTRSLTQVRTHAYWYISKEQRREFNKSNEASKIKEKRFTLGKTFDDENLIDVAEAITMLHSNLTPRQTDPKLSSNESAISNTNSEFKRKSKRLKNVPVVGPPNIRHLLRVKG